MHKSVLWFWGVLTVVLAVSYGGYDWIPISVTGVMLCAIAALVLKSLKIVGAWGVLFPWLALGITILDFLSNLMEFAGTPAAIVSLIVGYVRYVLPVVSLITFGRLLFTTRIPRRLRRG